MTWLVEVFANCWKRNGVRGGGGVGWGGEAHPKPRRPRPAVPPAPPLTQDPLQGQRRPCLLPQAAREGLRQKGPSWRIRRAERRMGLGASCPCSSQPLQALGSPWRAGARSARAACPPAQPLTRPAFLFHPHSGAWLLTPPPRCGAKQGKGSSGLALHSTSSLCTPQPHPSPRPTLPPPRTVNYPLGT